MKEKGKDKGMDQQRMKCISGPRCMYLEDMCIILSKIEVRNLLHYGRRTSIVTRPRRRIKSAKVKSIVLAAISLSKHIAKAINLLGIAPEILKGNIYHCRCRKFITS